MASSGNKFLTFFAFTLFVLYAVAAATPSPRHKTWCVAKPSADDATLRANIEFACSQSDCSAIQGNGVCTHSSVISHASVAMNTNYQSMGRNTWNCDFKGTGLITITDPSLGNCKYV